MNLLPSQPQSITQNIYDTFKVWWKSLLITLPFMIFMCIAVTYTSYYVTYIPSTPTANSVISNKSLWIICISFILILYILYAAIFHRINSIIYDKHDSLFSALGVGIKKVFFLLIATFITLTILAMIVLFISLPFIIIFHLISNNLPQVWPLPQLVLKPRIQIFALITVVVAYAYAAVLLLFYFPLIIVDNLGPFTAFSKSCYLVFGNWWRTAIIIGIMYFIIPLFLYIIQWFLAYHLDAPYLSALHQWMLSIFSQNLISIFYVPLFVSAVLVVMHDLKIRKGITNWEEPNANH